MNKPREKRAEKERRFSDRGQHSKWGHYPFLLTPGFSPVLTAHNSDKPFQQLHTEITPLEAVETAKHDDAGTTWLKPGVNETSRADDVCVSKANCK